eukprot:gene26398-32975_t
MRCRREAKKQEDLLIASMDPEDLIQVRRRSESDVSVESLNGQLLYLKIDRETCCAEESSRDRDGKTDHPSRTGFNLFKMIFVVSP